MYRVCRSAEPLDYGVFYGANIVREWIGSELRTRLNKRDLGWGTFVLGLFAYGLSSQVMQDVNNGLCRPLHSFELDPKAKPVKKKMIGRKISALTNA